MNYLTWLVIGDGHGEQFSSPSIQYVPVCSLYDCVACSRYVILLHIRFLIVFIICIFKGITNNNVLLLIMTIMTQICIMMQNVQKKKLCYHGFAVCYFTSACTLCRCLLQYKTVMSMLIILNCFHIVVTMLKYQGWFLMYHYASWCFKCHYVLSNATYRVLKSF